MPRACAQADEIQAQRARTPHEERHALAENSADCADSLRDGHLTGMSRPEVGTLVAMGVVAEPGGTRRSMQGSNVFDVNAAAKALARRIKPTGRLPVTPNQNR